MHPGRVEMFPQTQKGLSDVAEYFTPNIVRGCIGCISAQKATIFCEYLAAIAQITHFTGCNMLKTQSRHI